MHSIAIIGVIFEVQDDIRSAYHTLSVPGLMISNPGVNQTYPLHELAGKIFAGFCEEDPMGWGVPELGPFISPPVG